MKAKDDIRLSWRELHKQWWCMNCPDCMANDAFEEGKATGIRGVARWIITQQLPKEYQAEEYRGLVVIAQKQWQAKLKEWGIK